MAHVSRAHGEQSSHRPPPTKSDMWRVGGWVQVTPRLSNPPQRAHSSRRRSVKKGPSFQQGRSAGVGMWPQDGWQPGEEPQNVLPQEARWTRWIKLISNSQ